MNEKTERNMVRVAILFEVMGHISTDARWDTCDDDTLESLNAIIRNCNEFKEDIVADMEEEKKNSGRVVSVAEIIADTENSQREADE